MGADVWIDFRDLDVTGDISLQLDMAIQSCSTFLVLRSPGGASSPWMTAEYRMARQYNKRISPLETDLVRSLSSDALVELLASASGSKLQFSIPTVLRFDHLTPDLRRAALG
jgi:hypothetical protein